MDDSQVLERRVARLERTTRALFVILVAVLGLVGTQSVRARQDDPETVRARGFQIIDEAGTVRGELTMGDDGPELRLHDERGRERLSLSQTNEDTALYIKDALGTTRVGIAQFAHGGGGVALHGPESKGAAVLYLKETGSLRFFGTDGEVTLRIPE